MSHRHTPARPATTWIVAANRSAARIFSGQWPSMDDFDEIETLIQPEGRMHSHDVYPDRFGSDHAPDGHGFTDAPGQDFKHYTAERIAREVVDRLEIGRNCGEFGRLVIAAPPLLLGELRSRFSPALKKLIDCEINNEIVQQTPEQIRESVLESLSQISTSH